VYRWCVMDRTNCIVSDAGKWKSPSFVRMFVCSFIYIYIFLIVFLFVWSVYVLVCCDRAVYLELKWS